MLKKFFPFRREIIASLLLILMMMSTAFGASLKLTWQITGIKGDVLKNVQARLTAEKELLSQLKDRAAIDQFIIRAPEYIKIAIQPFGYFNSRVTTAVDRKPNEWRLIVKVYPGAVIRIKQIHLNIIGPGAKESAVNKIKNKFSLHLGDPFSTTKYEAAKEALYTYLNNHGFIKANFTKKEVIIDPIKNTAKIYLNLDTGEKYYFGEIRYQKTVYNQAFLKSLIPFTPKEPFSVKKLLAVQQTLEKSRYFQEAVLTPQYNQIENHHVPIDVMFTVPKAKKYSIGGGFGTLTGPRVTAGVEYRHLNANGHAFSAQTQLSPTLSSLAAKYYIPGPHPLTDQYLIGANAQNFQPENGKSKSVTGLVGFSRNLPHWQYNLNLNYLDERFSVKKDPLTQSTHSNVLYPSLSIGYTRTNDLFNPTSGYLYNVTLQGAQQSVLSQTSFFQVDAKGKYLYSPTNKSLVTLKGELGYTVGTNLNKLPLSLRYFAGGPGSLRGYKDSTIGPGRYLKLASIELQHQIYGNWYASVFHDVGNASDEFSAPLKQSSGVGVIYQSIIGPIRVYAAKGHASKSRPWLLQFSLGPDG